MMGWLEEGPEPLPFPREWGFCGTPEEPEEPLPLEEPLLAEADDPAEEELLAELPRLSLPAA